MSLCIMWVITQDVSVATLYICHFSCTQSQNKFYWKWDSESGEQDNFYKSSDCYFCTYFPFFFPL